jgi:hypothetical protein
MPRAKSGHIQINKSGQKNSPSSIFYTFYQKPYDQSTLKCQKPLISGQKRKKTKTIGLCHWDYTDGLKAKKYYL